ncbi:MAG: Aliphatic sulfonates family ABC transporter, periplasmic ligand-binding protein [Candidatus Wolfebacteria bacterium GW2011_GWE1_48_7]|uniref:Aliphatic sulfonates family ABC transporter, periplasmic ligand-binding protein n=2 Tax=Candidatus Wolfeibacteriota TaxID=1752735 RepID=A0A0G1WHV8_9BACT|nr:MAG: aliphatic sulfonate ABC transporter substrate-binding protein [Candidatus Wolfebacteria bacterium GW2011_GWB1_47_1]KKU34106.1 MAG: Aliphatic sulfonates family ABC transporter, periplasmic ligand-binding protein [Candidatus Wolfebacteria bacterium GW2011_GWC2_46_275]KKU40887.1 MAG: Aliphatic sulfonates family ABC transporter, periplasmic ligand-binding protein [Candidatus Wolfebacteria bacterium GW2011_GWB2_46_69]KKU53106.1 MAG: Aliphatic sulfonates family ABC transporter, periplasmic lig
MNKKSLYFVAIGISILIIAWFGYWKSTTTTTTTTTQEKIVIGRVDWPGYLGLIIADKKGYFKDEGLDVEVRRYSGLTELLQGYRSGEIQGKANPTFDCVTDAYEGIDNMAVIAIDQSNGADGIIARPGISSIRNLKGKKVGVERGTIEEFFLRYALDQYDMKFEDIIPVNLTAEQAADAVIAGDVDSSVTYEPYMTKAIKKSGGTLLFSSADALGVVVDVLTMRADFIDQYPDKVQAIVRAYFRAIDFWKANPMEANDIVAKELGSSPEDILAQLKGISVLDAADNRTAFTFAPGSQSLYGNMRAVDNFIKLSGKSSKTVDTDAMVEPRFIRDLFRSNQ